MTVYTDTGFAGRTKVKSQFEDIACEVGITVGAAATAAVAQVQQAVGNQEKKGDSETYRKYDPKEIEKRYGLRKGEFHREVKPDILSHLASKNSPYKDLMKKMGNNPDIYLSSDGRIEIVSTQFQGKSFITDLNITDFLP